MGHVDHQRTSQLLDLLQILGHAVEGPGQLPDFIGGGHRYPGGEFAGGDFPGDDAHAGQGGQDASIDDIAENDGQGHGAGKRPDEVPVHRPDKHGVGRFWRDVVLLHEGDEIAGGQGVDGEPDDGHGKTRHEQIDGQQLDDQVALDHDDSLIAPADRQNGSQYRGP
ncbi:hypothetical protein DESC_830014 [Desulfosarcina cetonica]|nr:hypothetical protein DESC_830014 [Desulfosarcina cetonica]